MGSSVVSRQMGGEEEALDKARTHNRFIRADGGWDTPQEVGCRLFVLGAAGQLSNLSVLAQRVSSLMPSKV